MHRPLPSQPCASALARCAESKTVRKMPDDALNISTRRPRAGWAVRVNLTDGPALRSRARSKPRYKTVPWPPSLGGSAYLSPPEKPLGYRDQKYVFRPRVLLKARGF